MQRKFSLKEWIFIVVSSMVVVIVQRLLVFTLRKRNYGVEWLDKLPDGLILAFWHNNSSMVACLHPNKNIYGMVSSSKDGEVISRVVESFGGRTVRGSSSRGGLSALKKMVRLLSQKKRIAFTPDGPRGPLYHIQDGIITAALRSQKPILPFHYVASRQWVFEKSWDKHRIPKPFSLVVNSLGEPFYLPALPNDKAPDTEYYENARKLIYKKMMDNMEFCQKECDRLSKKNGSQKQR